ncbi:MAG: YHS domain-containing protein, partial [Hyphomicrobiaceae bacterium]
MATHETHAHTPHTRRNAQEVPEQGVKDPVCGMTVDPHTAQHRHTYTGRPYYFCSASCREKM